MLDALRSLGVALAALLVAGSAQSLAAAPENSGLMGPPVPEGGGPVEVYVAMRMLDIDEVNSADQSFTANLYVQAHWHDPRLAHPGPAPLVRAYAEIWHPHLLFVNQQRVIMTFPLTGMIKPDGTVTIRQRVWGPFSQPLDVRDFPLDSQTFEVRLASAYADLYHLAFLEDPEARSGIAKAFSLPDWNILRWELSLDPYRPLGEDTAGVPSFALAIHAKRYVASYALKVIVPLVLIVAMSWIVFWIDPSQAGTQIGVATTSMLTLIAYRFMVAGSLPAVPLLTRMDQFILGCTALVFAALIQAVATSVINKKGHEDRAIRLDRLCRVAFPVLFAGILVVSFAV